MLGPPGGIVKSGGSLDVVSLGLGGVIVLGFGDKAITDRPGPDLVVFENPFWPGGDPTQVYAELGEALASKVPPRADETTIFKSLGMAVEDISAALLVYRSIAGS